MPRKRKPAGRPSNLRRKVGTRRVKSTFKVYCEGTVTEPAYITGLKHLPEIKAASSVEIRVIRTSDSVPMQLVNAAVKASEGGPTESEVDQVWCIFDVEQPSNHPNLKRAIEQAQKSGVEVAVSNPCFELWLILHFEDHNSALSTRDAVRKRQQLDNCEGKALDCSAYLQHRIEASQRARRLAERHDNDGLQLPDNNPSSGMYRFLDAIEGAVEQQSTG